MEEAERLVAARVGELAVRARGMRKRLRGPNSKLRLGTPSAQTVAMPLPATA